MADQESQARASAEATAGVGPQPMAPETAQNIEDAEQAQILEALLENQRNLEAIIERASAALAESRELTESVIGRLQQQSGAGEIAEARASAHATISINENSSQTEVAAHMESIASRVEDAARRTEEAAARAEAAANQASENSATDQTEEHIPLTVVPPPRNRDAGGGNNNNEQRRRGIWGYVGVAAVSAALAVGASYLAFGKDNDEKTPVDVNNANKVTLESNQHNSHNSTANQKRLHNLHAAENAITVPAAVAKLHSTPGNIKKNIHGIMNEDDSQIVLHKNGKMSDQTSKFNPNNFGTINGAEAVAFTSVNSPAYANMTLEQLTGGNAPDSMSHEQVLNRIESILTAKDTKFRMTQPNATFINHGQRGENIFSAGPLRLNGDTPVFTIIAANGHRMHVKVSNLCLNILTPVHGNPSTPGTPGTPETPGTPGTPDTPPKTPPKHPPKPPTPPTPPTPHHPGPKHDSNDTPAGVPGQNGGTPDKPGQGPAGQTPNDGGYLPSEKPPATPPQAPTPAPLPNNPAPTAPAETGPDVPGQPVAPSTGTGETVPIQDPNPQG